MTLIDEYMSGHLPFQVIYHKLAIRSLVSNRSTAQLSDECGYGRKKVETSAKMLEERSKKFHDSMNDKIKHAGSRVDD
jgi:hypothetical protein